MPKTVSLPPIKRIEGHGRVSLFVDENDRVSDAHFDVIEFRGFEKMLQGRMVWEMPLMTSRVCGVCPVAHHLAAVKAVDALYGVEIPHTAKMLRELMHSASFAQDHALHFFFLAGPDFLTSGGRASRDLLGVIAAQPEYAKKAIGIRRAGQRVVEIVGGQAAHPVTAIPGGMSRGLDKEMRAEALSLAHGMLADASLAAELAVETTARLMAEHPGYGADPVNYVAQNDAGTWAIYDGTVTVMGPDGSIAEKFDIVDYRDHIAERSLQNSYANEPYLVNAADGRYRVGPLARLNITEHMPTPRAQALLEGFRSLGRPVHDVLAYHQARMIELVAATEKAIALLEDDEIASDKVRVRVDRGIAGTGIAAIEAPRGTLIHHYEADEVGKVTYANLIVATTQNVGSLDRIVLEAVKGVPYSDALTDETFLAMEMGIRAHDPCLSCATHEIGRMPLVVEVIGKDGSLLATRGVR